MATSTSEAGQGQQNDGGHKDAGDAVHGALDGGAAAQGALDEPDDLRQRALIAGSEGADVDQAAGVQAAGDDRVAGALGHRRGFSAEQRFVGVGLAFHDDAVGGNALAGLDDEDLAGLEGVDGDKALARGAQDAHLASASADRAWRWSGRRDPWRRVRSVCRPAPA